jgi:hypothetical protein
MAGNGLRLAEVADFVTDFFPLVYNIIAKEIYHACRFFAIAANRCYVFGCIFLAGFCLVGIKFH